MEEDEGPSARTWEADLADGCYLVKERRAEVGFALLRRLVAQGRPGLVVSRRHPTKLRREEGFEGVRLVWLSHTPGEGFHNPTALSGLTRLVSGFIQEHGPSVVLLDGLEYLLLNNDFVRTLLFVEHVNEFVMQHPAVVLIPVNPEALEPRELALLERNLESLEGDALRRELEREEMVRLIDRY